jgi:tetratricopeptide (TPR) repeat protein
LIVENGRGSYLRFPLLDAEWESVAPALPLFMAGQNDRLQEVCDELFRFLDYTGRWDELLALNLQGEKMAAAAGDGDRAGWRAYHAGWVHYLRSQPEELLIFAARAEGHWESSGNGIYERAWVCQLRGIAHQIKGDYPAAAEAYREELELLRGGSPVSMEVSGALGDLADAERLLGDFDMAEQHFREALGMAETFGDAEGIAGHTTFLALLEVDRGDWEAAEELAREALGLSEALGRKDAIARSYRALAQSLVRQGRASEALPHARRAVEIYAGLRAPDLEVAHATLRECEEAAAPD